MRFVVSVLIGLLVVLGHSWYLQATGVDVSALVRHCYDGDTCRVEVAQGVWFNVRLAGIDAPELARDGKPDQAFAQQARDALNKLVKDQTVRLRQKDLDRYNRPVVEMHLADELVNIQMIRLGLAEVYRGRSKHLNKAPYFVAQERAMQAKKGIWSQSHYVSPRRYRR